MTTDLDAAIARLERIANGDRPIAVYPMDSQNPATGEHETVFDALAHARDLRLLISGPSEEDVARAIAAAFGTSWEAGVVSYRADPEIADEGPTSRYFLAARYVLAPFTPAAGGE